MKKYKFTCLKCSYFTDRKSSWDKHIMTAKHLSKKDYACSKCLKKYKYHKSMLRHEENCNSQCQQNITIPVNEYDKLTDILDNLVEQNSLLKQNGSSTTTVNNNTVNNNMTINIFLNEHCGNAMNIQDFIDNLQISLDDLMFTGKHGYVKGISNIFVKNLNDLDVTKRPIHCSDRKSLEFMVKDEDKWNSGSKKLNKSIKDVTLKQIDCIKAWEDAHPNWKESEHLVDQYFSLVKKTTSQDPFNNEKIQKKISVNVELKKEMVPCN